MKSYKSIVFLIIVFFVVDNALGMEKRYLLFNQRSCEHNGWEAAVEFGNEKTLAVKTKNSVVIHNVTNSAFWPTIMINCNDYVTKFNKDGSRIALRDSKSDRIRVYDIMSRGYRFPTKEEEQDFPERHNYKEVYLQTEQQLFYFRLQKQYPPCFYITKTFKEKDASDRYRQQNITCSLNKIKDEIIAVEPSPQGKYVALMGLTNIYLCETDKEVADDNDKIIRMPFSGFPAFYPKNEDIMFILSYDGKNIDVVNVKTHKVITGYPLDGGKLWINGRDENTTLNKKLAFDSAGEKLAVALFGQAEVFDVLEISEHIIDMGKQVIDMGEQEDDGDGCVFQ